MSDYLKIAELNKDSVAKIQASEADMGVQIMAFEPGSTFAELTAEQIAKVQELETELGVTLLVYAA